MIDKERFLFLLFKSSSEELSPSEQQEMWDFVSAEDQEYVNEVLKNYWQHYPFKEPVLSRQTQKNILDNALREPVDSSEPQVILPSRAWRTMKIGVAAAVAMLIFGLVFFWRTVQTPEQKASVLAINPGENKAILTLADGTRVNLEKPGQGIAGAEQMISKNSSGHLIYSNTAAGQYNGDNEKPQFHTITIPKGGMYQVTLADGTNVYLNSASSLKYPTVFSSRSREVEVTGEAYFDVSKVLNKDGRRLPFIVHSASQRIEVLGTQFNVCAYPADKVIKTTLVEGSVNVYQNSSAAGEDHVLLSPGLQATNDFSQLTVTKVNLTQVTAWKSGYFVFDNDNIREIMKQLSLWYNIDVSFEGDMRGKQFGGIFKRSKSIYQIIENIEQTGSIHFKVEERRITVIAN